MTAEDNLSSSPPPRASSPPQRASTASLPLVVDLDGTFLLTDSLHEQLLALLFRPQWGMFALLPRLVEGKSAFKAAVAALSPMAAGALPVREDFLVWLRAERARGREIHLCTAAHESTAQVFGQEFAALFTSAIGTASENLKGVRKADLLRERFSQGFVYAGNSAADAPVWEAADGVVIVGAPAGVARAARALGKPVEAEFVNDAVTPRDIVHLLRAHHWSKNFLLFVPLILGHQWVNAAALGHAVAGWLLLLAVTSATYVVNDLADLSADRQHWHKRHRPLARGQIPVGHAALAAVAALIVSMGVAFYLSLQFGVALAAYLGLTLAYSFGLKRVPLLDAFVIAALFTLRLVMGMALIDSPFSRWLLTFALFFFFSLAMAKRHTEVVRSANEGGAALAARGYQIEDAPLTLNVGVGTGISSLVIMTIFLADPSFSVVSYNAPGMLLFIPILLAIWMGRIWLLAHRGAMHDDPVSFALRDKASLLVGLLIAAVFLASL